MLQALSQLGELQPHRPFEVVLKGPVQSEQEVWMLAELVSISVLCLVFDRSA